MIPFILRKMEGYTKENGRLLFGVSKVTSQCISEEIHCDVKKNFKCSVLLEIKRTEVRL